MKREQEDLGALWVELVHRAWLESELGSPWVELVPEPCCMLSRMWMWRREEAELVFPMSHLKKSLLVKLIQYS